MNRHGRYEGKLCVARSKVAVAEPNYDGYSVPRLIKQLNTGDFIIPLSNFSFPFCKVLTRYGVGVVHLNAFEEVEL